MNVDACLTFLDFVQERHRIWEQRQHDKCQPWTDDPVLNSRKFTNVFRLLDPGSQFVMTDLLEIPTSGTVEDGQPEEEFLMRCFLYRHTNLPSAWRAYAADTGHYPGLDDLDDLREFWHGYKAEGGRVFSGAYMIYPQSATPGTDKIDSILDLTIRMHETGVFDQFVQQTSQEARFSVLRMNKGVADFMSMQILTDFGYSTEFRENDFVVPGPGARKGAAALEMKPEDAIEWAFEAIHSMDDPPQIPEDGYGEHYRLPSRMDVQNCLCEFSKYVRFANKPSPQKMYSPAHVGVPLPFVLPQHWHN